MSLEFRGGVQAMGINLESSAYVCISSTDDMTKDINLDTKEKRSKDKFLRHSNIKMLVR